MLAPDAQPNAAHRKLAELEQAGRLSAVITQNIDGLHQKAGSRTVYELHGSVHRNTCRRCGRRFSLDEILHTTGIPTCPCGGIIKPDVVLYEEPLDESTVARAVRAIEQADLLIVGGTSLSVYPAACFVTIAEDAWFSSTATPPRSMKRPACSYRNRSAGCWAPCAFPQGDESLDGSRYFLCHRKGRTSTRCPPFPIAHYSDSRLRNSLTETPVCRRKRRLR